MPHNRISYLGPSSFIGHSFNQYHMHMVGTSHTLFMTDLAHAALMKELCRLWKMEEAMLQVTQELKELRKTIEQYSAATEERDRSYNDIPVHLKTYHYDEDAWDKSGRQ